jgi:hypothetical protein
LGSPLDDGFQATKSILDMFSAEAYTLIDAYHTRNWDLLHGGGAVTLEHHDAEGYCTFLKILTGCKLWAIIRPKGFVDAKTRRGLDKLNKLFIRRNFDTETPESWDLDWVEHGGDVFTIAARPGDVV